MRRENGYEDHVKSGSGSITKSALAEKDLEVLCLPASTVKVVVPTTAKAREQTNTVRMTFNNLNRLSVVLKLILFYPILFLSDPENAIYHQHTTASVLNIIQKEISMSIINFKLVLYQYLKTT